jgi:hypothetical protein
VSKKKKSSSCQKGKQGSREEQSMETSPVSKKRILDLRWRLVAALLLLEIVVAAVDLVGLWRHRRSREQKEKERFMPEGKGRKQRGAVHGAETSCIQRAEKRSLDLRRRLAAALLLLEIVVAAVDLLGLLSLWLANGTTRNVSGRDLSGPSVYGMDWGWKRETSHEQRRG